MSRYLLDTNIISNITLARRIAGIERAAQGHDGRNDPGLRPAIVVRRTGCNPAILALRRPFPPPVTLRSRESIWTRNSVMSNGTGRRFSAWNQALA